MSKKIIMNMFIGTAVITPDPSLCPLDVLEQTIPSGLCATDSVLPTILSSPAQSIHSVPATSIIEQDSPMAYSQVSISRTITIIKFIFLLICNY